MHAEDVDWMPLVSALKLLPKAHYNTLKYLAEHLHRFVDISLCVCVCVCVLHGACMYVVWCMLKIYHQNN